MYPMKTNWELSVGLAVYLSHCHILAQLSAEAAGYSSICTMRLEHTVITEIAWSPKRKQTPKSSTMSQAADKSEQSVADGGVNPPFPCL